MLCVSLLCWHIHSYWELVWQRMSQGVTGCGVVRPIIPPSVTVGPTRVQQENSVKCNNPSHCVQSWRSTYIGGSQVHVLVVSKNLFQCQTDGRPKREVLFELPLTFRSWFTYTDVKFGIPVRNTGESRTGTLWFAIMLQEEDIDISIPLNIFKNSPNKLFI